MVEVKNITKIYGRGKKRVVALDGVSFTLGDRGMVFIVGKSGCGKSTLLNLIGGCDKLTAGDITVGGNKFSSFRERDYDRFRNDCVGFVFQDYCLLEGLSVEENVALALELKGEENSEAVREALGRVGLSDCADRRPAELSGGQKQRAAIARVLVKKPKLILADEPTGNLDEKSSGIVLDILKELSETALVVIVSHNRPDAEKYADRILELSEGKIAGDISRNPDAEDVSFRGKTVVIRKGTVFTEEQIEKINEKLRDGAGRLEQADNRFLPTLPPEPAGEGTGFAAHKLSRHGRRTLFSLFGKKRIAGTVVTALTIVFLMVVMGVCQLFTQFSPDGEIQRLLREEEDADTFIMQKGYRTSEYAEALNTDVMVRATQEDIAAFREAGYKGGIYPLCNVSVMSHTYHPAVWGVEGFSVPKDKENYANFFCSSALGVLVTDVNYLKKVYGDENGELTLLSGKLETEGDEIVLTDYFADSFLAYNPSDASLSDDPYANLTTGRAIAARFRPVGVIATGYRERYGTVIDALPAGEQVDPEAYAAMVEELDKTLNIAYSFDPGFLEAYTTDREMGRSVYPGTLRMSDGTHAVDCQSYCNLAGELRAGEVIVKKSLYAKLLGVAESGIDEQAEIGKKLTLTRYERIPQGEPPDYTMEVTVAGFMDDEDGNGDFRFSEREFMQAMTCSTIPYALYFDDLSDLTELYDVGSERDYAIRSPLVTVLYTVSKAALAFTDLFRLIVGLILLVIVGTLVAFGAGSVRKNMYEIAVVRALGGKAGDIALLLFLQMLIFGAAVVLFSVAGLAAGAHVCNALLGEGFAAFAKNALMRRLNFVIFDWGTALLDAAAVLILTAVAAAVPFLILRREKPREIIRAKE